MLNVDAPPGTRVEVRPYYDERVVLGTVKSLFSRQHVEVVMDGSGDGSSRIWRRDRVSEVAE